MIEILEKREESSFEELKEEVGVSKVALAKSLSSLQDQGVVEKEQDNQFSPATYRISPLYKNEGGGV